MKHQYPKFRTISFLIVMFFVSSPVIGDEVGNFLSKVIGKYEGELTWDGGGSPVTWEFSLASNAAVKGTATLAVGGELEIGAQEDKVQPDQRKLTIWMLGNQHNQAVLLFSQDFSSFEGTWGRYENEVRGTLNGTKIASYKPRSPNETKLLESGSCVSCDLTNADLTKENLSEAYLPMANLSGANLTGADLSNAHLLQADLTGANLTEADLRGGNLVSSNLTGADLTYANLSDADFREADLTNANLTGADLSNANLRGSNLTGANLTGANLSKANLNGANLIGANLEGTELDGAFVNDGTQFDEKAYETNEDLKKWREQTEESVLAAKEHIPYNTLGHFYQTYASLKNCYEAREGYVVVFVNQREMKEIKSRAKLIEDGVIARYSDLKNQTDKIWKEVTDKSEYINPQGGVSLGLQTHLITEGKQSWTEYKIPNDLAYQEICSLFVSIYNHYAEEFASGGGSEKDF